MLPHLHGDGKLAHRPLSKRVLQLPYKQSNISIIYLSTHSSLHAYTPPSTHPPIPTSTHPSTFHASIHPSTDPDSVFIRFNSHLLSSYTTNQWRGIQLSDLNIFFFLVLSFAGEIECRGLKSIIMS